MTEAKKKAESKTTKKSGLSKKMKQLLVGTGVVSLLAGGGIGAGIMHVASPANKTVLVTSYGNVKASQIFDRIKSTPSAQNAGQAIVMEKVLAHYFPKAATDAKLNSQMKKLKSNKLAYMEAMQQYGDEDMIKDNLKDSMLLTAAMEKEVSVSSADVKDAYENYRPKMVVAYVETDSKDRAEQLQPMLAQSHSYSDFKRQASELTKGDSKHISAGLLPSFSSLTSDQEMPGVVKKAAMKMNKNDTSDVIKTSNGKYAVLFMKSVANKGSYQQEKGKITKALKDQAMSSDELRSQVLAKYGKKAHVVAHDDAFKNLAKSFGK